MTRQTLEQRLNRLERLVKNEDSSASQFDFDKELRLHGLEYLYDTVYDKNAVPIPMSDLSKTIVSLCNSGKVDAVFKMILNSRENAPAGLDRPFDLSQKYFCIDGNKLMSIKSIMSYLLAHIDKYDFKNWLENTEDSEEDEW